VPTLIANAWFMPRHLLPAARAGDAPGVAEAKRN